MGSWRRKGLNTKSEDCFFASRIRHTRYWRDWSSDVCSSDLANTLKTDQMTDLGFRRAFHRTAQLLRTDAFKLLHLLVGQTQSRMFTHDLLLEPCRQRAAITRSEERRVGKECR